MDTSRQRTWDLNRMVRDLMRRMTNVERLAASAIIGGKGLGFDSGWINIPLQTGFTNPAGASPAGVRRIGDIVYFRGRPQRTAGSFTATYETWGTLPSGFECPENFRAPLGTFASDTAREMLLRLDANSSALMAAATGPNPGSVLYLRSTVMPL